MNRASSATGWIRNPDGTQGYTCSGKTGCLNHINGMCKGGNFLCYAYKLAHGRLKKTYLANGNIAQPEPKSMTTLSGILGNIRAFQDVAKGILSDPFYPRFWPERLDQIRKRKKPAGIFLDDMSDWMGDYWPEEWTKMELQVMRDCPQHRFYMLTKQPQNLSRWNPFPDNCWIGVTATGWSSFVSACWHLGDVDALVKFLSLEPLLEPIASKGTLPAEFDDLSWIIIGAQTKPTVYPRIEWVQEIVEAADKAKVPVFLKDNLRPLLCANVTAKDEWALVRQNRYKGKLWRQEFPKLEVSNDLISQ